MFAFHLTVVDHVSLKKLPFTPMLSQLFIVQA